MAIDIEDGDIFITSNIVIYPDGPDYWAVRVDGTSEVSSYSRDNLAFLTRYWDEENNSHRGWMRF